MQQPCFNVPRAVLASRGGLVSFPPRAHVKVVRGGHDQPSKWPTAACTSWLAVLSAATTLARSKPIKSCDWAALATDISANLAAMIKCISFKIPSPLFQVKHKTGLNRESIAMFNAALAVGI